jgi:hypothetical protein
MLPDASVDSGWDGNSVDPMLSTCIVYFSLVVGTVSVQLLYRLCNLIQKIIHHSSIIQARFRKHHSLYLMTVAVHSKVKLPPGATLGIAMLTHLLRLPVKASESDGREDQSDHSPSPKTFNPVLSNTACKGPSAFLGKLTLRHFERLHMVV